MQTGLMDLPGVGIHMEAKLRASGIETIQDLAVQTNVLAVAARTYLCDHRSIQTGGTCSEYKSAAGSGDDGGLLCRQSCKLLSAFCAQIRKKPPTPRGVQTIIKITGTLSVCLKVVRDPKMQQRSRKSIQTLWGILYGRHAKQRQALRTKFVTVYDMFDHDGVLYIVMEAMVGDGMHFVERYKGTLPKEVYERHLDLGWRGLLTGLVDGLFSGGLSFGDVKPQNIAYLENPDKSVTFKWIDVECIDNKLNGCFQVDFLDLYYLEEETGSKQPDTTDVMFFTDLWKIGLSMLTMLTGTNPVALLLEDSCGACSDFTSLLYLRNNLPRFRECVAMEVRAVLKSSDLPPDTRRYLRHFLDPDGGVRMQPVLAPTV